MRSTRLAVLTLAALAAMQMGAAGQQTEPSARADTSACDGAPDAGFTDTSNSVHKPRIDCVAWRGVTTGKTETTYGPGDPLKRGQVATFTVRSLTARGVELPTPSRDYFTDDQGGTHEANTNILAEAGILDTSTTSYEPESPSTRSFMARVTAGALAFGGVQLPTAPPDYYTDDSGDPNELAINQITDLGIVTGKGGGVYAPGETLTRGQMATFLARELAALVEEGRIDGIGHSGTSDDVWMQNVPMDVIAMVDWSHSGSGHFSVVYYDDQGGYGDLVANETGEASGRSPVNFAGDGPASTWEISADGAFQLTIVGMGDARVLGTSISGSTPDVVDGSAAAGQVLEATHSGTGHFSVVAHTRSGGYGDLLYNETGQYQGAALVPSDAVWLVVDADGPWTLTIRQQ